MLCGDGVQAQNADLIAALASAEQSCTAAEADRNRVRAVNNALVADRGALRAEMQALFSSVVKRQGRSYDSA